MTCFPCSVIYTLLSLQSCVILHWHFMNIIISDCTTKHAWYHLMNWNFLCEILLVSNGMRIPIQRNRTHFNCWTNSKTTDFQDSSSSSCPCITYTYLMSLRNDSLRNVDMKLQKPHIWSCPPHTRAISMYTFIESVSLPLLLCNISSAMRNVENDIHSHCFLHEMIKKNFLNTERMLVSQNTKPNYKDKGHFQWLLYPMLNESRREWHTYVSYYARLERYR